MYKVPPDHTKFKKGQSGNPKGRPKLPDLKELLAKVLGNADNGTTSAEAILSALEQRARRGDVRAAELLLDRAYGKPKQDVDLSGSMVTVIKPKPIADS
jgi:hypothetical protein